MISIQKKEQAFCLILNDKLLLLIKCILFIYFIYICFIYLYIGGKRGDVVQMDRHVGHRKHDHDSDEHSDGWKKSTYFSL